MTCASASAGNILYVSGTTGNDANNGSTWDLAKKTVTAAISASVSGDQIWVAKGVYGERVSLKIGVGLYGGFAGTETALSQRVSFPRPSVDPLETTLDGNNTGSTITMPVNSTAANRVDGFTIINGAARGIEGTSGNPVITNNIIRNNGAGIGNLSGTITNNIITGNTTAGGIICHSALVANNIIAGNASSSGGGVYCSGNGTTIINNTIVGNYAKLGGGIYCDKSSSQISNNIVAFNSSGIYVTSTSPFPTLRNNNVYNPDGYNYSGIAPGTGDISCDPKLTAPAYAQLHIQPGSPCIDAGLDTAVQSGWTDIDGGLRKLGSHVDIGADESNGTTWTFAPSSIKVRPDGDDTNDGNTWTSAKRTIKAALAAAQKVSGEVWAAEGVYNELMQIRGYSYIYGGFAGTETLRSERSPRIHTTEIRGDGTTTVLDFRSGHKAAVVDGFTISNIRGSTNYVGCVYVLNCSPQISNNVITGGNASRGAGIVCYGGAPLVCGNSITANAATIQGGAVYSEANGSPTLLDNVIIGNSASDGGAVYCLSGSIKIIGNTIIGNSAQLAKCGAIRLDGCSASVANNIIAYNSSGLGTAGTMGTIDLLNNCVYNPGGSNYISLAPGAGDVSVDPGLVSVQYGQVHLQAGSSCIDTGNDSASVQGWPDIDGRDRVHGDHVDIGADEYDGTGWVLNSTVVRVSPGGNDGNDGSSWTTAKKTIQAAVDAAASQGGEVWVAQGTYNERVVLRPYVSIYGGFAGSEESKDQRNYRLNETIIDAGGSGCVVTAITAHSAAEIDGFTIRNGKGDSDAGCGILCSFSSPSMRNNLVTGNKGSNTAAIICRGSSVVENNSIAGNGCSGIYNYGASRITGNYIADNAGAGISSGGESAVISGNTVFRNKLTGIQCSTSALVANNYISSNGSSGSMAMGGGIGCGSGARVMNNTIIGNVAERGGGIYAGPSATISGNIIAANSATRYGGGIYCAESGTQVVTNNTVFNNFAPDGGGIYTTLAQPVISNNIVANNSSGIMRYGGTPVLRSNCVYNPGKENYIWLDPGTGDISADPRLASTEYGQAHLQSASPCIDAGDNSAVEQGWLDIDGQDRMLGERVDIGADEFNGTTPVTIPIIVRVGSGGNDGNDGSSWAMAKKTVQAAIDAVAGQGGEVWVARGVYSERVFLKPYVYVYGGFAGTETALAERDWETNETILDGGAGGSVVSAKGGYTSINAIDGFTIRNGSGTPWGTGYSGGGIFCYAASPAIVNNKIISNKCISQDTGDDSSGGAVYCTYGSPSIVGNKIIGNKVDGDEAFGGAIYLDSSAPLIKGNTLVSNSADRGAAICCTKSSPDITANRMTGNSCIQYGAGIYCDQYSAPNIHSNIFSGNYGSGVHCEAASPTITNNTLVGNFMGGQGAIAVYSTGAPVISNNLVAYNTSGIYNSGSGKPVLQNNLVYNPDGLDYSGISTHPTDISADPKLVSLDYGRLHLLAGSPCINAGLDSAIAEGWVDIDVTLRRQGDHVDIGADESDGSVYDDDPVIVRVSPDGSDSNDGSSWDKTKQTLQAAANAAFEMGGEVWVAAGTYTEQVLLHPYTSIYGGFAGGEESRDQRNWQSNQTIIDGSNTGTVLTIKGGIDYPCVVDGLVIRNGKATEPSISMANGGGICCLGTPITVSNNIFTHNNAYSGGALYCNKGSRLLNNVVTGNSAPYGGGFYTTGGNVTISGCRFMGNSASIEGGGLRCYGGGTISDNVFESNAVTGLNSNGAAIFIREGSGTINGNTFSSNSAVGAGGGIHTYSCALTIHDNLINLNAARIGAGIYAYGTGLISDNRITDNTASQGGGGIYTYGSQSIAGNIITGNNAATGGGVYCASSSPVLTNNCVLNNTAMQNGGAFYIYGNSSPKLYNNIMAYNSSGIFRDGTQGSPIVCNNLLYNTSGYNYSGLAAGIDDISADPLFMDWTDGNYHLQSGSPCINAGNNDAQGLPALDLDGEPRIQCGAVDIGIDETGQLALPLSVLAHVKSATKNAWINLTDPIVTAAFTDYFYIESSDRQCGIRVDKTGHQFKVGMKAAVDGVVRVNSNGECYIYASSAVQSGSGTLQPLFLNARTLGGAGFGLQAGVDGGVGLSNIGLLIRTCGKYTYVDSRTFKVDDGSGTAVKCMVPFGVSISSTWKYVQATGISSIELVNGKLQRVVRVRTSSDIKVL